MDNSVIRQLIDSMINNDTIIWINDHEALIEEKRLKRENFSVVRNIKD